MRQLYKFNKKKGDSTNSDSETSADSSDEIEVVNAEAQIKVDAPVQ